MADDDNELSPEEVNQIAENLMAGIMGEMDPQDSTCVALATFYHKLQDAGFPEHRAYDMVKSWFLAIMVNGTDEAEYE
jgi:hypothetical protein